MHLAPTEAASQPGFFAKILGIKGKGGRTTAAYEVYKNVIHLTMKVDHELGLESAMKTLAAEAELNGLHLMVGDHFLTQIHTDPSKAQSTVSEWILNTYRRDSVMLVRLSKSFL